jgi:hypothetical protein
LPEDGTWPGFWFLIATKLTSLDYVRQKVEELGWNLLETEDLLLVHRLSNLAVPESLGEGDLDKFLSELRKRRG